MEERYTRHSTIITTNLGYDERHNCLGKLNAWNIERSISASMCAGFWKRIVRPMGTSGAVRRPDRLLAAQLHERGVPLEAVANAFVLAATRRSTRPTDEAPLGTIRSLAYFSPVIEEVLHLQVSQEYFQYLRHKLQRIAPAR